ncbi:hypothetical protein C1Y63_10785 [Corynebacterium sp. 13CS0277]|nr:hypothetical protein C1Y63_10785 [Corynebacterium sp. 13CS0277]
MTNARIRAEQTHTNETLALVSRQDVQDSEASFTETMAALERALEDVENSSLGATSQAATHVAGAREAMESWATAHDTLTTLLAVGRYQEAVQTATGAGDTGTSAAAFNELDDNIAALISDARASLRAYLRDGVVAARTVPMVVVLLSIMAVLALWLGIRPRLQEYL